MVAGLHVGDDVVDGVAELAGQRREGVAHRATEDERGTESRERPGEPFVVSYADVVKAAGHSCPTAAGAFRIARLGLDAPYPDALPVRSDVEVIAAGPRYDPTYGVTGRLLSYVPGAAGADGFGGIAGGVGNRRHLLAFDGFEAATALPTFRLRRTDTDETVEVTYHVDDIPDGGPALGKLQTILDGAASVGDREAFAEVWHGRVRAVLSDDVLFTIETGVEC